MRTKKINESGVRIKRKSKTSAKENRRKGRKPKLLKRIKKEITDKSMKAEKGKLLNKKRKRNLKK